MCDVQATPGTALKTQEPARAHRSNFAWVVVIAGGWIALDQASKQWAASALTDRAPVSVVGELLQLRLVFNSGAAFSLGTGSTWIFTILASVVIVMLLWNARRLGSGWWALALGLLIGGAGGNLVDRLAREPGFGQGHVVDFLALPNFPVFNVADIGITSAAVLIILMVLRGHSADGAPAQQDHQHEAPLS